MLRKYTCPNFLGHFRPKIEHLLCTLPRLIQFQIANIPNLETLQPCSTLMFVLLDNVGSTVRSTAIQTGGGQNILDKEALRLGKTLKISSTSCWAHSARFCQTTRRRKIGLENTLILICNSIKFSKNLAQPRSKNNTPPYHKDLKSDRFLQTKSY